MIEINLLPQELKVKSKKFALDQKYIFYLIPLILGLLIFIHIYLGLTLMIKKYQYRVLDKKWQGLESERRTLEELKAEYDMLSGDAKITQQIIKQKISWAKKLNRLSLDLPSGIWFVEISLTQRDFSLKGAVISLEKEEIGFINKFIDNLKNDVDFLGSFNNLELGPLQRRTIGTYDIVEFILSGSLKST